MIVQQLTAIDRPVRQYLVPVLTDDFVLQGLVHIDLTEFNTTPFTIEVKSCKLTCNAYSFNGRVLFCLMYPASNSDKVKAWSGLPNFQPVSQFQMTSYWAFPVGNLATKYVDFGQAELLTSSRYDPKTLQPMQSADHAVDDKTVATIKINVPASRWPRRYAVLDLNWMSLLISKLKMQCTLDSFKDVQIVSCESPFKAFVLTNDNSGVPQILRLMLNADTVSKGEYQVVMQIQGEKQYLVVLNFSLS